MIPVLSLSPMAGVADSAMRVICARYGCRHVTTEMISAAAVYYKDKKTLALASVSPDEPPCAVQIFGHDPDIMAYAVKALYEAAAVKPVSFDINMGCPVKKVVNSGDGSALMLDIKLAGKIIEAVVKASPVPVSVKMRAGFDKAHKNAVELALAAEACGAEHICVHGRTRQDMYAPGTVDYGIIADVKQAVKIPVIANGDIFGGADAQKVLSLTGADGISVARGALGNPFIFGEINAALSGVDYIRPTLSQRLQAAKEHLSLLTEFKGGATAALEARKHMAWYIKGFSGAAEARQRINTAESGEEMIKILDCLSGSLE